MPIKSIRDLLDEHPFFADLEESDRALIAGCGHNVRFGPGEILFQEGDFADYFYVIRRGRVALEIHAPGRGPTVVDTLVTGEVVGASWIIPPYRRHLDARSVDRTSAVALECECLRAKCEENAELGYRLMKRFAGAAVEHLQDARLQLLDVYGDTDGARVAD